MRPHTETILPAQELQIFCLPFSGGSAYAFQPLATFFPNSWQVTTLAYPGRGSRMTAPLVSTMEALVEDSWQQIKNHLNKPYVLFGHSLGSLLAYLLAQKAAETCSPLPRHLFLAGTDGPKIPAKLPHRYLFSKADFKQQLKSYGGISDEILNNEAAFDFFEPIIRADFQAVETWKYSQKEKLNIPATVITGTEENLTRANIETWQEEFEPKITFRTMEGPHFFLFNHAQEFVNLMKQDLTK